MAVEIVNVRRAELLRDQVKLTWSPPQHGIGQPADLVQTAVMQTLAWVLGRPFLGDLTDAQETAVADGLKLMEATL